MINVSVKITGHQRVSDEVFRRVPARVEARLWDYARSSAPRWENLLKAVIEHVVYDAYHPGTYKRNRNLIKAVDKRLERTVSPGVRGSRVRLFDNSDKIKYRRRPDGTVGPRGGASPDEVPWQIELGNYPQPWFGFSAARPAYGVTAGLIRTEVKLRTEQIVREAIRPR